MAAIGTEPSSFAQRSTPTASRRSLRTPPRSATPHHSSRPGTPWRKSAITLSASRVVSAPASPQRLTSALPATNVARPSTPQMPLRVDVTMGAQRSVNPPRLRNSQLHSVGATVTGMWSLESSSDAAKQSLMRRVAADATHLRSAPASQPTPAGPAAHLFEDPSGLPVAPHSVSALHALSGSASSCSFPSSPNHVSPSLRLHSPTLKQHHPDGSAAGIVKSASTENAGDFKVEICVGAVNVPRFTEEKAQILRQKLREMENHHDTMYHSGLASRLA